jgi:hypothetical protein
VGITRASGPSVFTTSSQRTSCLIIPDSHCNPSTSNRRYEWLGNLIVDRRPDIIVDLGDFGDLATLGVYDRGTKAAWGKYYKDEVEHIKKANKIVFDEPVRRYNNTHAKAKKAKYAPRKIRLGGNHEEGRINAFLHKNPEWVGHISIDDLGFRDYGCEYVPFLRPFHFSNVAFSHYWYVKTQRYPIGTAKQILKNNHKSSVSGHAHSYDLATDYGIDGKRMTAIIAGCYLDPEYNAETFNYTGGHGTNQWTNGLTWLHDVNHYGEFDVEFISTDRVRQMYG